MGKRRRKMAVVPDEEKENEDQHSGTSTTAISSANNTTINNALFYTIFSNVQQNETFHKKYIKEMRQLYAKTDHEAFVFTFIKMLKAPMEADEANDYANNTLNFCAKVISSYDGDETHPLILDVFDWLLNTISNDPHIRYRLCQFVNKILNALGPHAALDDNICDQIMAYMMQRLRDFSPSVRVQAILAMQRLQLPDNPKDPVIQTYEYHLSSDPSPRVRQAVITCIGRNVHTIPFILERLWDIDEKVRRHTYLHMSSYPVRSYKVVQRLTLLEQGLNDRSEAVRKVVTTVMLQQWIESYERNFISLLSALKLDSNGVELNRFRKIAKQMLREIFSRQKDKSVLLRVLPVEEEADVNRYFPPAKLSIEVALYWQCLAEHLQAELAEEYDQLLPELSVFCQYVENFCSSQRLEADRFSKIEFQYILLSLMEILNNYDLGDEIGRGHLKSLLSHLIKNYTLDEQIIQVIVKCAENLIVNQNERMQFFIEIIQEICQLNWKNPLLHDRALITKLLEASDTDLKLKLSSLKVMILDIEEKEMDMLREKNYTKFQEKMDAKNKALTNYLNLLRPMLEKTTLTDDSGKPLSSLKSTIDDETVIQGLQVVFHMIVSPKVKSLNPFVCKLYDEFICRYLGSINPDVRDWSLKCGTAYSMLYEALSRDMYEELHAQFLKNNNIRMWETATKCIFELLDRYGINHFSLPGQENKPKRQLYNTLNFIDIEQDEPQGQSTNGQAFDVVRMMTHMMDSCLELGITRAIVRGFCCLILKGHITNSSLVEKLLLRYFNPDTDPSINQCIGVFFECLLQTPRYNLLLESLLPTVNTVMTCSYDSSLNNIRPETIMRFVIDSTRCEQRPALIDRAHNKLAVAILQEMMNNVGKKELCKILAKEITTLDINVQDNAALREEMKSKAEKLLKFEFDSKTIKSIVTFKDMLDGNSNGPPRRVTDVDSDEDNKFESESMSSGIDRDVRSGSESYRASGNDGGERPIEIPIPAVAPAFAVAVPTSAKALDDKPSTPEPDVPTINVINATATTPIDAISEDLAKTRTAPLDTSKLEDVACSCTTTPQGRPSVAVRSTPTTYGAENREGLSFLRKSLNISRTLSECGESPAAMTVPPSEASEQSPRQAKIRIEARIDSDKKAQSADRRRSPNKNHHNKSAAAATLDTSTGVSGSKARRNLRYTSRNERPKDVAEVTLNDSCPEKEESQKVSKQVETRGKPGKRKSNSAEKQKQQKSPETGDGPRRITTRRATALLRAQNEQGSPNEKMNSSSEVIDESPQATKAASMSRRVLVATSLRAPRTRLRSATLTEGGVKPATAISGGGTSKEDPTPVRNGRKRILQQSPVATATATAAVVTPSKRSGRTPLNASMTLKRQKANTPPPTTSQEVTRPMPNRRKTIAAPADIRPSAKATGTTGGSPSSTKENDLAGANKRTPRKKNPANDQNGALEKDANAKAASKASHGVPTITIPSPPRASRIARPVIRMKSSTATTSEPNNLKKSNKNNNINSVDISAGKAVPMPPSESLLSSSTITTRNYARRDFELSFIMTRKRKRLSLDSSGRSRSSSRSNTSLTHYSPKTKVKAVSRIPIRKPTADSSAKVITRHETVASRQGRRPQPPPPTQLQKTTAPIGTTASKAPITATTAQTTTLTRSKAASIVPAKRNFLAPANSKIPGISGLTVRLSRLPHRDHV